MPLNYKGKGGSLKTCDYYITSLGFASCEDFSATLPVSREVNPATLRHVRNPFSPRLLYYTPSSKFVNPDIKFIHLLMHRPILLFQFVSPQ